jgi:hypothetical protein
VIRIKLADLEDNMEASRMPRCQKTMERIRTRYEPAKAMLEARLAQEAVV